MKFSIVTLFPEMFSAMQSGVIGKALEKQIAQLSFYNPRDYSRDKHKNVDDRPYGGGPGMVMMAQPLEDSINEARGSHQGNSKVILMSPQGKPFNQKIANQLAEKREPLIFVNGRYEGIDQRLIDSHIDEEYSLGDFVISGGELASMVMIDTIVRLLPGALGHQDSAAQDSFMNGLLDCPHFTRPETLNGTKVPQILLSGNHQQINQWRLKQSLGKTWQNRPDLIKSQSLNSIQKQLLEEYISEHKND